MNSLQIALALLIALPTINAMHRTLQSSPSAALGAECGGELTALLALDKAQWENNEKNRTAAQALIKQAVWEFQQGNLLLFDGLIGDNQCHLTALHVVELFNLHALGDLDLRIWIDGRMNPVVKYLTLKLLHSSFSKHKKSVLRDRIAATYKQGGTQCTKKDMLRFLESRVILEKAKIELSRLTMQWTLCSLQAMHVDNEILAQEISDYAQIAQLVERGELPVVPKYAGMELFLHRLNLSTIPLIVKVKTLTNDGVERCVLKTMNDGRLTSEVSALDVDIPVIVIEGITLRKGLTHKSKAIQCFKDFMTLRNCCPQNLFYQGKRQQHPGCLVCTDSSIQKGIHPLVGLLAPHVLRTISASFMDTLQQDAAKFMGLFPQLQELFVNNLGWASNEGLCTEEPCTFFIEHMYPSVHNAAITNKRLLARILHD